MDSYAEALGIVESRPKKTAADPFAGLPAPQAGMTGRFVGSPDDAIAGISAISDPQERSNALAAFQTQMRGNGGKLDAPKDPYAEALGIGGAPQPTRIAAPAAPPKLTLSAPEGLDGSGLRAVAANQVTGLGSSIVGGYRGLATLLSGGTLDDAANNVRDYTAGHTFTPQQGTEAARSVDSFSSPYNPANVPAEALDWAGGKVTDVTGSPALGALVNGGGMAALSALGLRGRPATRPVEIGPSRPATGIYQPVAKALPAPADPVTVDGGAIPARPVPVEAMPVPDTPEAVQAVAEKAPTKLFPETPTTAPQGRFSPDEQLARAKVLRSVGIETARRSALEGDGVGGSTDFQTSKLDSPAGRQMRAQIESEKNALINHADSLVAETGGTHGVDSSNLYARGNAIVAPLDALKEWFDNKTSALYKAADERAQGVPTPLSNFSTALGDASELTNSDRVHLQGAVNAYIKKLGMAGEDGSVAGSAKQAETIRKYLNEQWSPQNSRMVGKLKDALDEDVTSAAGEDIYGEARRIRTRRGQTLDNPNGIAKLMDSSGPEGINRAVPVEKIADSLTGMPVDQFSHVVQTLRNAPPELTPQAQTAISEIKAQFANKVQAIGSAQAGQWNAKGVTKYLQNNAARMAQVFTPEEIAKFRNLNDAGHIVAKDQSYPGAAVQEHNLATQGVMAGLPTAGAAAGGYFAGPMGAAVGSAAGRMAAGAVENAATMRAVKKRTVPLAELLDVGRGQ